LQEGTGSAPALDLDSLNRAVIEEPYAVRFGDGDQAFHHLVKASHREPHAAGQFGVLQQGKGGRRIVWAQPQVHILESERGF